MTSSSYVRQWVRSELLALLGRNENSASIICRCVEYWRGHLVRRLKKFWRASEILWEWCLRFICSNCWFSCCCVRSSNARKESYFVDILLMLRSSWCCYCCWCLYRWQAECSTGTECHVVTRYCIAAVAAIKASRYDDLLWIVVQLVLSFVAKRNVYIIYDE